jgi:hypothetical protein
MRHAASRCLDRRHRLWMKIARLDTGVISQPNQLNVAAVQ